MATKELSAELNNVSGASYPEIFAKFRELAGEYGVNSLISTYNYMNSFGSRYTPNPYTQNTRIKGIATKPAHFSKDNVAQFVQSPDESERPLRAVEKGLEYTSYPMFHTRMVYQNLLTYHSYITPTLTDKDDSQQDDFWREWKLLEKLRLKINPKDTAHELTGRALQEGKVFVYPRISVDKSHNKVNYAFLQRLPSDWTKIVGYNNISKYTVAFNLMYFCQMGTDWRQFGNLFEPYITDWFNTLSPAPSISEKSIVYASKTGLNLNAIRNNENIKAYRENGRWFYWVTLPADKIFPIEIDDTNDNVIPPFAGLFLDMIQLSQMEQIQLEILQNPLVSILHGEMETWNEKGNDTADEYKISDAGRRFFLDVFYDMLIANNTSGIGMYAAPFKNMKLESLDEAPNATKIVSAGYTDMMSKAGLTAIIPTSDEARAGAVQVSYEIESQFAKVTYRCFERMMNIIIEKLNLNYDWRFVMHGDLASDKDRLKELKEAMTLGILPAVVEYNSLLDKSILDDIALSDAISASKLMDKRIPLTTSFTQSAKTVGRPPAEEIATDGAEQDIDNAG